MRRILSYTLAGVAAMPLSWMLVSCTVFGGKKMSELDSVSLSISSQNVDASNGSQFVTIDATGYWELEIVIPGGDGDMDWAWFEDWDNAEGTVLMTSQRAAGNPVLLRYSRNHSDVARKCNIIARCGNASSSVSLTQQKAQAQITTPTSPTSDKTPMWLELPATDDPDCFYVNHEMRLGSDKKSFRNYSLYMSRKDLVAHWVAYPLNSWTISSGTNRTNDWGLDPKIPRNSQPVIFSAFGNSGTYARGHQIPSADRYAEGANQQTFYGSNMTPQRHDLNSYIWASLEGTVRNWSRQFDTLYVVTGCNTAGSSQTVKDNDGKNIKVPSGYYKVLLGFNKKKNTAGIYCSSAIPSYTGYYSGIAFYFDHTSYVTSSSVINGHRMTIDALEDKLGIDFFANLPGVVGDANAKSIEQRNDNFWTL